MDHEQSAELERLRKVLNVAQRNGNALFIENIERESAAVERGEPSPLIEAYLTEDERSPQARTRTKRGDPCRSTTATGGRGRALVPVDDVCEVIKREFDVDDAFLREGLIGYAKSLERQQQAQQQQ